VAPIAPICPLSVYQSRVPSPFKANLLGPDCDRRRSPGGDANLPARDTQETVHVSIGYGMTVLERIDVPSMKFVAPSNSATSRQFGVS